MTETTVTLDLSEFDIADLQSELESQEYRVFSDDEDGLKKACEWLGENDYLMFEDYSKGIEAMISTEGPDFVMDLIPTDAMVAYNVLHNPLELVASLQKNRQYIIAQSKEALINYVKNDIQNHLNPFDVYSSRTIVDELRSSDSLMEEFIGEFKPDELMGPIESTDVINHLESSIAAMVIRLREEPTDEMLLTLLGYLDEFQGWREQLIRMMHDHGILLETILRVYVDAERSENGN